MDSSELRAQLESYHRASYGWALNCCSQDPAEAEGVLQTVYLKILEGRARFDGKAAFKTWLFSVIRNTAADERRRTIVRRLLLMKYMESPERSIGPDPPKESPDEAIYRSQLQALFRQALAALPKRQQEVLELVFYHDFSLQEASEVMGISLGSARTHYERGKKQLRQLMSQWKDFDESGMGRKENKRTLP